MNQLVNKFNSVYIVNRSNIYIVIENEYRSIKYAWIYDHPMYISKVNKKTKTISSI